MTEPFDPARHITQLKGSDYLEVKWRLVWLRDRHPDAVIETELIAHDDKLAIFKATVSVPGPSGSATGFGSETPGDFRDYIEKAETKAIGRALAALGFGTQFAGYEDGASNDRPVDSPVKRDALPRQRNVSQNTVPQRSGSPQTNANDQTAFVDQKALSAIHAVKSRRKVNDDDLHAIARLRYGVESLKDLTVAHGRDLYKLLDQEDDDALASIVYEATREPGADDEPGELTLADSFGGAPYVDLAAQYRER